MTCGIALTVVTLFIIVDLFVNYSTWKDEAKFPSLNEKTIREYKRKCWRDVVPLLIIGGYLWLT